MPTRGAVDLDDYSSGFGVWSGTSFAAPALAGDIAKDLGNDRPLDVTERSKRAQRFVASAREAAAKTIEDTK